MSEFLFYKWKISSKVSANRDKRCRFSVDLDGGEVKAKEKNTE